MAYRLKKEGKCKAQYGAKKENVSCEFMNITQSAKVPTLNDPSPSTTVTIIGIYPTGNSPIRSIISGNLTLKDADGNVMETVTGVVGNPTFGNMVFSLVTGFNPTDSVMFCFGDVVGKDVNAKEYTNSFECPNEIQE